MTDQRPGPLSCMPIASTVLPLARLSLAAFRRGVEDRGGTILYEDTDSVFVAASSEGGEVTGSDGRPIKLLRWREADEVCAGFDGLSPSKNGHSAGWPFWKSKRGAEEAPQRSLVIDHKKHIEWTVLPDGGIEIIDYTETGLGGVVQDRPDTPGRHVSGGRAWTHQGCAREHHVCRRPQRRPDACQAAKGIMGQRPSGAHA